MSTVCKFHVVSGYIRSNYIYSVPEPLIRICLLYFDETFIIKFKGKRLNKFLSMKNKETIKYQIKFNQNLTLKIHVAPNGRLAHHKGKLCIKLGIHEMTKTVEYFRFRCSWNCVETESSIRHLITSKAFFSKYKDKPNSVIAVMGSAPRKQRNTITLLFSIQSLIIKYQDSPEILYYPSLQSVKLKEKTKYQWKIDRSLINKFMEYSPGEHYESPPTNNVCIVCYPNMFHGKMMTGIRLLSFPINVQRMKVKIIAKCNFCDVKEYECMLQARNASSRLRGTEKNLESLKDELVFDVEIHIMEIYDVNGDIVPTNKWIQHNIDISE